MKNEKTTPNQAADKSKSEGDRWQSNADTVEQRDSESQGQSSAGITNRPAEEEEENQNALPERGESRDGANAGHGHLKREERNR